MEINIGINSSDRKRVADSLSRLLADTYTTYLKTQNFHWNVTGPQFYSLHLLFEKQYQALAEAADNIAERIRALGYAAPASYREYGQLTAIAETTGLLTANDMIKDLVKAQEAVCRTAREISHQAEAVKDEATVDLMAKRIHEHEEAAWMLRSLLMEKAE